MLCRLSTSVTLGGLAAGLVGVASQGRFDTSSKATLIVTRLVGLVVLALAIVIAIAACFNFYTRGEKLKAFSDGPWDSQLLVGLFGAVMLVILMGSWITAIAHLV